MQNERRQCTRIASSQQISVWNAEQQVWTMQVRDYSMHGIGIVGTIYTELPSLGEVLRVQFSLNANNNYRIVDMTGKVKHIGLEGTRYFLGLEF